MIKKNFIVSQVGNSLENKLRTVFSDFGSEKQPWLYIPSQRGVLWPSGLVHWTQVLALSECGFDPGRSWRLCP